MNFIFLIQFKYEKHSYCLSTVYFLSLSPLTQRVFYAIKKLINYPLATNYSDIEVMNNFNFKHPVNFLMENTMKKREHKLMSEIVKHFGFMKHTKKIKNSFLL